MGKDHSLISVVVPVFNEAENIQECLRNLWKALKDVPHEILICYDNEADTTLPAIEEMPDRPPTIRLVKNNLGCGVAFALRAGFQEAQGDVVVSFMADLSDPPEVILAMAEKVRKEGAQVVSGSRYMKGGRQIGGPPVKRALSWFAGWSLHWLAGLGTRDATTNFRAYSAEFLRQATIESFQGFEVGLELTVKGHLQGKKISEVPSIWRNRRKGISRFKMMGWMPHYLGWYMKALSKPLLYGIIFCSALIFLLLTQVSWQPFFYFPHLDISWNMVLHYAFETGRRFGDEIVFPYGPYGFVYGPFIHPQTALYYPSTFRLVLFIQAFFCVAGALALQRLVRLYLPNPWEAAGWLAFIIFLNFNLPLSLGFLLNLLYWVDEERPIRGVNVLLTLFLGWASLIKFNYFVMYTWIFAVMALEEIFRWRRWPWLPCIFLTALVGFWLSAGQTLAGLGQYIWNSLLLNFGYNEAMVWEWPAWNMLPYLGATGMLLALVVQEDWKRSRFWGLVSTTTLLGACFLVFKSSFVRHEGHHEMIARLGALTVVLLYLPVLWPRFQRRLLKGVLLASLATAVFGLEIGKTSIAGFSAWTLSRIHIQARGAYAILAGKANFEEIYENQNRAIEAQFPFGPAQGSVGLYSYEQAYVIGPRWRYSPRPVFQSYAAFTPALAEMNARHLRGPHAPDTIFFSVQAIDGRYPSLEDGLSWPELLSRYNICERVGWYLRLERGEKPRPIAPEPLKRITARFGEEISIQENENGPLWAEVEIHPTLFNRLASLIYKAPFPVITVNGQMRFRMLPSLARAGFLLSPLVADTLSFENLAANPKEGIAVKSIRFDVRKSDYFRREIQIRLFRMKITPQRCFARRLFEKSGEVLWRLSAATPAVAKFTPLEQATIFERQGGIVLRAMGTDPSLLLPDLPLGNCSFVVLRMELTSPAATRALVAWETEKTQGFTPLHSIESPLVSGRNTIFMAIPAQGLKGRLRLQPGRAPGEYVLHSFEVRESR